MQGDILLYVLRIVCLGLLILLLFEVWQSLGKNWVLKLLDQLKLSV